MKNKQRAVTLIELLVASMLIGVIVLAISNIELFSRFHVIASDKRAKLQNEVAFVMEHLTKTLTGAAASGGAIGYILRPPITQSGNTVRIWVDLNRNGRIDNPPGDIEVAYSYQPDIHQLWYYPNFSTSPGTHEVMTSSVIMPNFGNNTSQPSYFIYNSANNYVDVQVSACYDPDGTPEPCNTQENPQVTMQSRIQMPAVSTH